MDNKWKEEIEKKWLNVMLFDQSHDSRTQNQTNFYEKQFLFILFMKQFHADDWIDWIAARVGNKSQIKINKK